MSETGMTADGPIILLGGQSRAARAIRDVLASEHIIGVVRKDPGAGDIVTPDYSVVPQTLALEKATIINCVGSPHGDADALMQLNRDVPVAWAEAGKAAGARGMVQISSFSVFGLAEEIDRHTPLAPAGDYGRSKLAAEQALAAIATNRFPITLLRVPILVGGDGDKLAQLVRAAKRFGVFPAAARPTPRSMLPYEGLAVAVRSSIVQRPNGPVMAADPEAFSPALLQEIARENGRRIRKLALPAPAANLIKAVAPGIHSSLLTPSLLSAQANILQNETGYERVRDVIARLMAA